ncbi:oligoendopeptidase F [Ktedonospora formicarum]|uniref:Oligopeptidase F n=1 Tax=Ktedonospora formicarum TaxID=2778364 RepID=A0A8J3MR69_9CHLR|nr:oligoendopeptidase F [Ktedonospora formicarum]GHO45627.1 oligoendopeptidase F [Ktedonospora formicarum]
MQSYKNRSEIPTEYKWNLESIYANNEDWERDFQYLQKSVPELATLQGTLGQSGEALLNVLSKRDEIGKVLERLYVYTSMRRDEDTTNSLYQGMADRAMQLYVQVVTAISYIEPELLALPQETLESYINAVPGLNIYRHQLDDLNRKRPHIRSAEVEAILAASEEMASAPDNIFSMIDNADMKLPKIRNEQGEEVELTQGNYLVFVRSKDRRVRQEAFEGLHNAFLKQRNTIASTLSGQVKADAFYTRQRNFESTRQRALSAYNIPESVYDNLVQTVNAHTSLINRYLQLRKRVLKLDEMHMYDLYVPIVEEKEDKVTYQEAGDIIIEALSPLGENYIKALKRGLGERWIDVYETPGKRSGAYSGGSYSTQPFILLNYQDNRDSMFTMAHELGHSLHSYFTRTHQPYQYGDYTIFVAEVASTLNEGLLTNYLLKHTSDKGLRLAILNHALEDLRGTLYRQTMFAEFEQAIHSRSANGEPLTADSFSALYKELNEKYYGGETFIDDLIGIEWARIPHFYSSFYVYQYATGISASSALVQKILHEGQPAVDRYINFLSSGSSKYSIDLLKDAGVDMTTPEPVHQAFQLFESYLSQMEELLG